MAVDKYTKADIIDAIYNKTGTSRKEIRGIVDLLIEELKSCLVSHKVIELRGFGTFEVKVRRARKAARNPKTGESFTVASHGAVVFRPGKELKRDTWSL